MPSFKSSEATYTFITGGLSLIFMLAQDYYTFVQRKELDTHACHSSALSSFLWTVLHLPLATFLFFVGLGFKESFKVRALFFVCVSFLAILHFPLLEHFWRPDTSTSTSISFIFSLSRRFQSTRHRPSPSTDTTMMITLGRFYFLYALGLQRW
jgi:hypothetical protein